MGQSNIAAGATIGSNHNSRAADGELIASRGFWPALCVSLKHNSKFASFTLLAKGDYQCELNIPLPFSLVRDDETNNRLVILPAYWFMYNMYALERNAVKYVDRDKRTNKIQHIEYDYLAPDTINEVFDALHLLEKFTGLSVRSNDTGADINILIEEGRKILNNPTAINIQVLADGFENSGRPTHIIKVKEAYHIYKQLVVYYSITQLINYISTHQITSLVDLVAALPAKPERLQWMNIGGQLLPNVAVETLKNNIKDGKINSWEEIHDFYHENSRIYNEQKLQHAFASLIELYQITPQELNLQLFKQLLQQTLDTKEWMIKNIRSSRAKDYQNDFRKMAYDNEEEMEQVLGSLEDNVFINQQKQELIRLKEEVNSVMKMFGLEVEDNTNNKLETTVSKRTTAEATA
jgi:hypothetical protein